MKKLVILVSREGLGQVDPADRNFSIEMFDKFLHSLESRPVKPEAICFYTEGVRLLCSGSAVLLSLRLIEGLGVRLVGCRSCLEHFGLAGSLGAGEIVGMNEIVEMMAAADSVVSV